MNALYPLVGPVSFTGSVFLDRILSEKKNTLIHGGNGQQLRWKSRFSFTLKASNDI